jgi:hypothetical protein
MANNSKPDQRKSSADGVRAAGGSAENEDIEDEIGENSEGDGQGIRTAGAEDEEDENGTAQEGASRKMAQDGQSQGQGRQSTTTQERGGRNARGR